LIRSSSLLRVDYFPDHDPESYLCDRVTYPYPGLVVAYLVAETTSCPDTDPPDRDRVMGTEVDPIDEEDEAVDSID
jgi:hypothetical protein